MPAIFLCRLESTPVPCAVLVRRLLESLTEQLQQVQAAGAEPADPMQEPRLAAACWLVSAAADKAAQAGIDDRRCLLQLFAAAAPLAVACLASGDMAGLPASVMHSSVLPSTHALSSMVSFLAAERQDNLGQEVFQAALAPSLLLPTLQEALPGIQRMACLTSSGALRPR